MSFFQYSSSHPGKLATTNAQIDDKTGIQHLSPCTHTLNTPECNGEWFPPPDLPHPPVFNRNDALPRSPGRTRMCLRRFSFLTASVPIFSSTPTSTIDYNRAPLFSAVETEHVTICVVVAAAANDSSPYSMPMPTQVAFRAPLPLLPSKFLHSKSTWPHSSSQAISFDNAYNVFFTAVPMEIRKWDNPLFLFFFSLVFAFLPSYPFACLLSFFAFPFTYPFISPYSFFFFLLLSSLFLLIVFFFSSFYFSLFLFLLFFCFSKFF